MKSHWRPAAVVAIGVAATAPQPGTNRAHGPKAPATNRWFAMAGAVIVAATQVAVLLVGAAPAAAAVTSLQKVAGPVSASDSESYKEAYATCPTGKKPVGGGGWIFTEKVEDSTEVALVGLLPWFSSGWSVRAAGSTTGNWSVQAYAICASAAELPGYAIIYSDYEPSDSGREHSVARCPGKRQAVGGGAFIEWGGISLTQLRSVGFGFEAVAVENAGGPGRRWDVTAIAVCINKPQGYVLVSADSAEQGSEDEKFASVRCPSGTKVMSAGAGIVNDAPDTGLKIVYPTSNLRDVEVFAVETYPKDTDWGRIKAHAVCVS